MSDFAIRVENLSKRYRIGLEEEQPETLVAAMADWLRSPIANFRQLRSLSHFSENGREAKDIIWALKDVSFDVHKSEVMGIIGPNGAGKTTLLKILSRVTEPTYGRAIINGRVSSLLEVGTGFHPDLTGRENVYLNGTILGMSRSEVDRKFEEIVDFSGVEKFIDTPVKRYSSGMQVRLAFSVAAHLEPEILLVDEVLAVGDAAFQKKCLGKMGDVAQEGRTVLFVSHNMTAVSKLCSRLIWLDEGGIRKTGIPDEVISNYLLDEVATDTRINFPEDEGMPAQIIMARLLDPVGVENHVFRTNEPFMIELKFRVRQSLSNLRLGVVVQLPDGSDVFSTSSTDSPSLTDKLEPGLYSARLAVPENLLAARDYLVSFFLDQPGICTLDFHQRVLSFAIVGTTQPYYDHRRGIIAYPFEWQIGQNETHKKVALQEG